ncbi:MAG: hypothetical protein COA69_09885 [Robiginitomaculum sp.]|nr:MAG: hypothetical protein COA69_09885 [Robiginitomaculum sp.]
MASRKQQSGKISKPATVGTAKNVPTKNTPPKNVSAKKVPAKPVSNAQRDSLVKLRTHMVEIETRLSRANSLTRASVIALNASFEKLQQVSAQNNSQKAEANTARLATYIDELSTHLTGLIEKTRTDVAHDLQVVMADPRLETLSIALTKANKRLTCAESKQTEVISTINGQIAKLAGAIDDRMQREVRAREESYAVLKADQAVLKKDHISLKEGQLSLKNTQTALKENLNTTIRSRIDTVEEQSAEALKTIGAKIVNISEDLQQRTQSLKHEVGEQGLSLQQGYEEHKAAVSLRIEALEDDQRSTIPSLERRLVTLATRIEVLEILDPTSRTSTTTAPAASPFGISSTEELTQLPPPPTPPAFPPPYASRGGTDAFSPSDPATLTPVTPSQNPYAPPMNQGQDQGQDQELPAQPQEFTPQNYTPQNTSTEFGTPELVSLENQRHTDVQDVEPSHAPFNPQTGAFEPGGMDQQGVNEFETAPPPFMTNISPPPHDVTASGQPNQYEPTQYDPAQYDANQYDANQYDANMDESMYAARPGAEANVGKKGFFSRKNSAQKQTRSIETIRSPIKIAALMTGVAVLGLFAAKTILPKFINNSPGVTTQAHTGRFASVGQNRSENAQTAQIVQTVDAVGDYSQTMKAPDLGQGRDGAPSAQKLTLEAAAKNGEPIAQFQLGLSHLEAGRNAEAVRLIRLAANQGQAAAQYRLGKLYEAGIGVDANAKTAMDFLERSAEGGNRIAMHDLGHYHAIGAVGAADITQAVDWFKKAADRGVLDSQFNLGVLYQGGSGVNQDPVEAYIWFAIAGAQGDKVATQRSTSIAQDLSKAQLTQAQARVKAFTPLRVNDIANGVFTGLPWSPKAQKPTNNITNLTVRDAQGVLLSLGYDVGSPDGAMGPRTRNAVIRFERANGLPETGRVNAALLDRLNLAAGT